MFFVYVFIGIFLRFMTIWDAAGLARLVPVMLGCAKTMISLALLVVVDDLVLSFISLLPHPSYLYFCDLHLLPYFPFFCKLNGNNNKQLFGG